MCCSKVYVGDLDDDVGDGALRAFFGKYGTVLKACVKVGRGYGFVTFVESAAAKKAILSGHRVWNVKALKVDESVARKMDPLSIRFTHSTISFCFRTGAEVDDAIRIMNK